MHTAMQAVPTLCQPPTLNSAAMVMLYDKSILSWPFPDLFLH